MKRNLRTALFASAILGSTFFGAGASHSVPLKWTDLSFDGVADPATSLPGAGLAALSITPGFIDSKSQYKDVFGALGDAQVESAMESASWFNVASSALTPAGGGDCGGGGVTCSDGPPKSGVYSGVLANLFVVHVGGSYNDGGGCTKTDPAGASSNPCEHGGGIILAFLYSTLLDTFSVSGFSNGVSWIRSFNVPSRLLEPPSEVPLPAGVLLLLSALGGMGFVSRSRKAKVAA